MATAVESQDATDVRLEERPFKIQISDSQLELLQKKLELTTYPDELEESNWSYGPPLADMKRLLNRWKDGFNWRDHEAALNDELPQFKRGISVDGFGILDIHYVHKPSELKTAIPLLFVHGWPGSFIEVRKILPLLTGAVTPSFHVVALSLPGYGFSSGPTKKGFSISQYAEVCHRLMLALGYDQYVTQGGDWGYYITKRIAVLYGGTHSKAWHTNYPRSIDGAPSFFTSPMMWLSDRLNPLTEAEKTGLARVKWFRGSGRGYAMEQATQPQTIGYSLSDSPAGLLAWIYEKLVLWSDNYPWEDDEVLTWVSIYLFSLAGPTAAARIYYEKSHERGGNKTTPTIPMGYSYFPKDLFPVPKRWLWDPNLVFEGDHTEGGHFAAYEKPDLLVGDLRKMFGKDSSAFGVVPGKTGYEE